MKIIKLPCACANYECKLCKAEQCKKCVGNPYTNCSTNAKNISTCNLVPTGVFEKWFEAYKDDMTDYAKADFKRILKGEVDV